MAVFRIEKNVGYTVMSNHHLRNKNLSLKSKGLLSQMLSLPENWDYTLKGLSMINKESIDAIRTAIWELEKTGYVTRRQGRDEHGKMTDIEYTIYEQPKLEQPMLENPISANSTTEKPTLENPMQLNTNLSSTKELNTDLSITKPSNPIQSNPKKETAEPSDGIGTDTVKAYRKIIKGNIEYDIMCERYPKVKIDEITDLMTETVCTSKKVLRIAGDDFPAKIVKSKLLKLDGQHIEYVLDCMSANTTQIRNIKKYLLAALFNAPSTIDSYYTAQVNHDLCGGGGK